MKLAVLSRGDRCGWYHADPRAARQLRGMEPGACRLEKSRFYRPKARIAKQPHAPRAPHAHPRNPTPAGWTRRYVDEETYLLKPYTCIMYFMCSTFEL